MCRGSLLEAAAGAAPWHLCGRVASRWLRQSRSSADTSTHSSQGDEHSATLLNNLLLLLVVRGSSARLFWGSCWHSRAADRHQGEPPTLQDGAAAGTAPVPSTGCSVSSVRGADRAPEPSQAFHCQVIWQRVGGTALQARSGAAVGSRMM